MLVGGALFSKEVESAPHTDSVPGRSPTGEPGIIAQRRVMVVS